MLQNSSVPVGEYNRSGPEMLMSARTETLLLNKTRQRTQLSCDRCRRLKRKCDRQQPCSECTRFSSTCTYDRARETTEAVKRTTNRRKENRGSNNWIEISRQLSKSFQNTHVSPPILFKEGGSIASTETNSSDSSNRVTSHSTEYDSNSENQRSGGSIEEDIDKLIREMQFLRRIMTIWWRDVEWMMSLLGESSFEKVMMKDLNLVNSQSHMKKFGGILYTIVAMCALKFPTDVEGCLVCMTSASERHGFYSASAVRLAAFSRTEKWLEELAREKPDSTEWPAEAFQTTLLHGLHIKFTGNWNLYREISNRNMERIQRAGFDDLSGMVRKGLCEDEIVTRNKVFWRYFHHDRIMSLFDGVPYKIQARYANNWLFESGVEPIHIRNLCRDSGSDPLADPTAYVKPPVSATLRSRLEQMHTPYSLVTVKLAALAGRCSDRLSTMHQSSLDEDYIRAEQIAAETDEDLLELEKEIENAQLSTSELPAIILTVARVRRDITTRITMHVASLETDSVDDQAYMVQVLERRCLNTAKSLIRHSTGVVGSTPIRVVAMPFFTLFVAETMIELLTSVENAAKASNPSGSLDSEAKDDLKHALIGRNFLVLLARIGEIPLNKMVAQKACTQASTVLQVCLPDQYSTLHRQIMDLSCIRDPDPIVEMIPCSNEELERRIDSQSAEDILNFLDGIHSFQHTFEIASQFYT